MAPQQPLEVGDGLVGDLARCRNYPHRRALPLPPIHFGPRPPKGLQSNWVQTIPGKGWFMILRLYGPLEPWFDKTWKPGEIELQP